MKTKTRFNKLTAWMLTLAMLMTFMPGFTLGVSAAETGDIALSTTSNYILKFSENSTAVTWGDAIRLTYTVTVATSENGTVVADVSKAAEGDTVTLSITPNEGYALKTLTVDGTDVTENVTNNAYTFEMPAKAVTVTATFAEVHSVTRTVYVGGLGLAEGEYLSNSSKFSTTAPANEGYAHYSNGVLTLKNYESSGPGYTDSNNNSAAVYSENALTIELAGESTLTTDGMGIFSVGDITIGGTGTLKITSNGDGVDSDSGDITVNGGTLYLVSEIGKGIDGNNDGNVTITGGSIQITAAENGIEAAKINISGGNVNINDTWGYIVAGGSDSATGTVTITGGSVNAAMVSMSPAKNAESAQVYLATIDLSDVLGANAEVKDGDIVIKVGNKNTDYDYNLDGVRTNKDGIVYLWLPKGSATAKVSGYTYVGTVMGAVDSYIAYPLNRLVDMSEVTVEDIDAYTYTGNSHIPMPIVKYNGTTLTLDTHYTLEYSNNINAGTATVTIKGKSNYSGQTTKTFVINPKPLTDDMVTLSKTSDTYTGTDLNYNRGLNLYVSIGDGTALGVDDRIITWEPNEVIDAGTYTLKVTGQNNYTGTVTKTFTVEKADITVTTVPSAKTDLVYNGNEQELVSTGVAAGGELQYSLDGVSYSTAIPKGTDAGSYTVYYKVVGDKNHNDTEAVKADVTIAKKTIDNAIILTAPVKNTVPQTEITGTGYTATVVWSPEITDKFAYNTEYTATVTITPDDNHTVTGITANGYTVEGAKTVTNDENSNVIIVAYEKTGSRPSSGGGSSNTTTTTTKNEDGSTTKTTTNKATGTTTEVTTNTDGSTTTVETKKDGTVTTTEKNKDGSETVVEKDAEGTTTTTEKDSEGNKTVTTEKADGTTTTEETKKDGTTVKTETNSDGETTAEVKAKGKTEVVIPIENADEVTKVVVTDESGKATVITDFELVDNGIAITVDGNASVSVSKGSKKEFVDVHLVNHWATADIDYIYIKGLMKGTNETHFSPNALLTRAMLVTVLYRLEGEPETNKSIPFNDVDMSAYYANAVIWAKQNSIVNGMTENEFSPDISITREQIVTIIMRYAVYKGMDAATLEENLHFDDSDEIYEYAVSAMNWAVGTGLIKGKSATTINPKDNATRAEIAAILHRFIESNK